MIDFMLIIGNKKHDSQFGVSRVIILLFCCDGNVFLKG